MKRWKKIALGVVVVLAVSVAAVGVWQWENIRAAYLAVSQDSEQIAQNAQEQREKHQAAIEEIAPVTVTPPTAEQSDALLDNLLTPEEVKKATGIANLLGQDTPNTPEEAADAGEGQESQQTPQDSTQQAPPADDSQQAPQQSAEEGQANAQEIVDRCVAELYACKIDLMAELAQLKQAAVDEWNSLPAEEQTTARMLDMGFTGLNQCYALEQDVDGRVKEILARYKEKLAEAGGDAAVIDTLWDYYEEEKASDKAYYINKYMDKYLK